MVDGRPVWQVAGGGWDRDFSDQFLKHGVALIGPGDSGPWRPERDDEDYEGSYVRRFATEVHCGDVMLLRLGAYTLRAVGIVASEYIHLEQFDDVNGWDIQHARRVRWCELPSPYDFPNRVFGAVPARFSAVWNENVLDYVQRFIQSPPTEWQTAILPPLPKLEPYLKDEDVPSNLRDIVGLARDMIDLYWDRENFGELPREDELVAHFVVPLLRGLGWTVERVAVKWQDIDVTVFDKLPRKPENVRYLIEAKRRGAGVEGALDQARRYVKNLGVPVDIVVTDGIRYRMYAATKSYSSVAYANLANLKLSALDLFSLMRRP